MRLTTSVESSRASPTRSFTIAAASIVLLTIVNVLSSSNQLEDVSAYWQTATEVAVIASPNSRPDQGQCLSLDVDGGDMDHLLEKHKQVFLVMPAKAAGTTYKAFTKKCMAIEGTPGFSRQDNVLNNDSKMQGVFREQLELPSLLTSHLYTAYSLHKLIKHATKDTLIIYSHREETSRLMSSIKEVINRSCFVAKEDKGFSINEGECKVTESMLIKKIKEKKAEIRFGSERLWTCDTFESIRDNAPNMAFVHYKQANKLQKLLRKHHCPESNSDIEANVGASKKPISIILEGGKTNGTTVPIDDWLDAKSQMLELVLLLKTDMSCQATVRRIEESLIACPEEALQISGRSHDNQWIQLSK